MKELWKVYTRNFVDDEGIVKAIRYIFFSIIICWIVIKLLLLLVANMRVVYDKFFFFGILVKYIFINIIFLVIHNWFSLSFKLIKTLNITFFLKKKNLYIYIYLFICI